MFPGSIRTPLPSVRPSLLKFPFCRSEVRRVLVVLHPTPQQPASQSSLKVLDTAALQSRQDAVDSAWPYASPSNYSVATNGNPSNQRQLRRHPQTERLHASYLKPIRRNGLSSGGPVYAARTLASSCLLVRCFGQGQLKYPVTFQHDLVQHVSLSGLRRAPSGLDDEMKRSWDNTTASTVNCQLTIDALRQHNLSYSKLRINRRCADTARRNGCRLAEDAKLLLEAARYLQRLESFIVFGSHYLRRAHLVENDAEHAFPGA